MRRPPYRPALDALEARQLLATAVVESEPNGRPATADRVALDASDGTAMLTGMLAPAGDADFFAVPVPAKGRYRVAVRRLDAEGGPIRLDVSVGGTAVSGGTLAAGDVDMLTIRGGRTVQLRLRGGSADYALAISAVRLPDPTTRPLSGGSVTEIEPNDTAAQANTVVLPGLAPLFVRGTGGAFDLDTFAFRAPRGGLLQVSNLSIAGPARYLLESDEFPSLVGAFADVPAGGSFTVPIYRGVRYRLRWIVDSPVATPYVLRLQVLPVLAGGVGGGGGTRPPAVPPFGGATTP